MPNNTGDAFKPAKALAPKIESVSDVEGLAQKEHAEKKKNLVLVNRASLLRARFLKKLK